MTLIETLVAIVLAAIVTTTIYNLLVPGARIWQESQKRIEAQQAALLGMNFLIREVEMTTNDSVTIYPDDAQNLRLTQEGASTNFPGISFLSSRGPDGILAYDPSTGAPYWTKFHIIYLDDRKTLRLAAELYLSSKGGPPAPELLSVPFPLQQLPPTVTVVRKGGGGGGPLDVDPARDRAIARDVVSFAPRVEGKQVVLSIEARKRIPGWDERRNQQREFSTFLETRVPMIFSKGGTNP